MWVRVPPAVLNPTGEQIVQRGGVDLCVETFGDAGDPAILLIHGAGNSMLSWDEELCERLAAGGRHVIRYDLRNAGRSTTYAPGTAQYGYADLADDAVALLGALRIESAHVVGMSFGVGAAQLLALDQPEHVAALTLASSTPGGPGHATPDLPGPSDDLAEPSEPDWYDRDSVVEYLVEAERPFAASSRPFDAEGMRALMRRVAERSTNLEWALTDDGSFDLGEPWRERLGEIRAPTLVVHGAEDPLFPFEHGEALAREIPGAALLPLEATSHEYFPRHTWDVVAPAIFSR